MNWKSFFFGVAAGIVAYHMVQPVREAAIKVLGQPR